MKKPVKIFLISVACLILLAFIGTFVTYLFIANSVISEMADIRVEKDDYTLDDFDLQGDRITVTTEDDIEINSYVIINPGAKANIFLLHGMHGMDATSVFDYAKFLYDDGYSVISVDMRAHGKSGGENLSFGYLEVLDILAVIDYIKSHEVMSQKPIALYGLSMGASAAINTAAYTQDISAVIAVSPFMSIQSQVRDYMSKDNSSDLFINSFMPAINMVLRTKFDISPKKQSPIEEIRTYDNVPLFIMHGMSDTQTLYYHSQELYDNYNGQKTLSLIENADHLIVEDVLSPQAIQYRNTILDWLNSLFN